MDIINLIKKNNKIVDEFRKTMKGSACVEQFTDLFHYLEGIPLTGSVKSIEIIISGNLFYVSLKHLEIQIKHFGFDIGSSKRLIDSTLDKLLIYFIKRIDESFIYDRCESLLVETFLHFTTMPFLTSSAKYYLSNFILLICKKYFMLGEISCLLLTSSKFLCFPYNSDFLQEDDPVNVEQNNDGVSLFIPIGSLFDSNITEQMIYLLMSIGHVIQMNFMKLHDETDVLWIKYGYPIGSSNGVASFLFTYIKSTVYFLQGNIDKCMDCLNIMMGALSILKYQLIIKNCYLLCALCLSSKMKHHMAIQMLKKNLMLDGHCHLSVCLLSCQYFLMNLPDAQLKCLQILYQMKDNAPDNQPMFEFIMPIFISNLRIRKECLLHGLATACYNSAKYNEASIYFEELLSLISTNGENIEEIGNIYYGTIYQNPFNSIKNIFETILPAINMKTLYKHYITSLIKCKKYNRAVQICEDVIDKTRPDNFEMFSNIGDETNEINFQIEIQVLKFQVYTELRLYEEAIRTITSAILFAEERCIYSSVDAKERCIYSSVDGPSTKRFKTESRNIDPGKSETRNKTKTLLSDMYYMKSKSLEKMGKHQDAMHFSKISYEINPENPEKAYALTLHFENMGRHDDASNFWLKFRNITAPDKTESKKLNEQRNHESSITKKEVSDESHTIHDT